MKKLAIITSHPIQYNAPLFKLLASRKQINVKVFYTWGESVLQNKFDPGFKRTIQWDVPLLEGYEYEFLENTATDKGTHHFKGIINPAIIERINAYHPDALLIYGWSFQSHLKVLRAYHNKLPILFRGDSTLLGKPKGWKQLARRVFLTWVYRMIDHALVPGKRNFDYYLHAGVPKRKLVHAPHAIDNDRFAANDAERNRLALELRKANNIPEDAFVFLYAGKLDDNKNAASLLEAFQQASLPDTAHLMIVGNGELEVQLKSFYSTHSNIHFLPFQNQQAMPVLYRSADVYVLPSKTETWGLAANEAMVCGLALLLSDQCGGAVDLIREGVNGFTFKLNDQHDLQEKLKMLARDRQKVKEMGKASKKMIAGFSFERIADTIENVVLNSEKSHAHTIH
jgi:glycosyltransferase involved in cell wall biosynthesis